MAGHSKFPAPNIAPGSASLQPSQRLSSESVLPDPDCWQEVPSRGKNQRRGKVPTANATGYAPAPGCTSKPSEASEEPEQRNANLNERFSVKSNPHSSEPSLQPTNGSLRPRGNPDIWNYFNAVQTISQTKTGWLSRPEVPTANEIMDVEESWERIDGANNVVLQGNHLEGAWASRDIYLEAHYSLFREDAVRPLREAVAWIRSNPSYQENNQSHNIGVYDHVRIRAITFAAKGLGIRISFSLSRVGKKILWGQSKRLISGSLVALTPTMDMFQSTCIVAVVAARSLDLVRQHQIDLFFARSEDINLDPDIDYVMIEERSSFFEAQRHTLAALQKMSGEPFPLSEYLVDVQPIIQPPEYVTHEPKMDLTALFASEQRDSAYESVNVLQDFPSSAPTLDDSQLEALQRILKKSLALVQGPPGTGKTHVSIMALKVLLVNHKFEDPPIIIACQTNHALDQILRLVSQFELKFARLGGRSKDTGLIKDRTLFSLRLKERNGATVAGRSRGRLRSELKQLENHIRKELKVLTTPSSAEFAGVLDHHLYRESGILSHKQCDSLEKGDSLWSNQSTADALPLKQWLGQQLISIDRTQRSDRMDFEFEEAELDCEELQEIEAEALDEDDEWDRLNGGTIQLVDDTGAKSDDRFAESKVREILRVNQDMWKIKQKQRGVVFEYLRRQLKLQIMAKVRLHAQRYYETATRYRYAGWEEDFVLLRRQKIIGLTTTGLSKYRPLIESLKPKVLLIEEAAETLEAPVTAGCFSSLQHLILVGDHKQLRPQCAVKELEGGAYNLNVSLFERLVNNGLEFSILHRQRRMIPEIRRILRPVYGDDIVDHPSVEDPTIRPPVPGMALNSFFFTHDWPESKDNQASTMNEQEAQMVVEFINYIVCNGVPLEKITVLTFYNGQRKLIQTRARAHPNVKDPGLKVVTVDSYQGEENDIVLLSLVRSNVFGGIGFLNVDNRVCVALSRARRGFFLFGNAELLAGSESRIWHQVIAIMSGKRKPFPPKGTEKRRLGYYLPITCSNHDQLSLIDSPEELGRLHGGCDQKCLGILTCGHNCPLSCHPFGHDQVNCALDCNSLLDCGHRCAGRCGDPCFCYTCQADFPADTEHEKRQDHNERTSSTDIKSGPISNARTWNVFANGGHRQHDAMLNQKAVADAQEFEKRLAQLQLQPVPKEDLMNLMARSTPSPPLEDDLQRLTSPPRTEWASRQSCLQAVGSGRYTWIEEHDPGQSAKAIAATWKGNGTGFSSRMMTGTPVTEPEAHYANRISGNHSPPHMRRKSQDSPAWFTSAVVKTQQQSTLLKPKKQDLLIDID